MTPPPDEPFDQHAEDEPTTRIPRTTDQHSDEETPMDQQRRLGDRYEVGELLGRGGMAEVHSGRDLRLGRTVAIKSLRVDLARDPSFQNRFRREAQSAASLNHPNIVAIYDTGEEPDPTAGGLSVPYIVMEPVKGTTLRALLNTGRRLLPERALEITSGVLAALDYSHRHGIVHRDIKPANVMLTDSGELKVMDFGIARAIADSASTMTSTGATLGTAQYLSPEQAQGGDIDPRSDIYSTGCMLYELLTGQPPFTGESPVSVAYQHVRENPVPPSQIDPDVPVEIDAIVMKSLAKNPDNRYQTALEMQEDIDRALRGSPVAASPIMDETRAISTVATTDVVPPERSSRGRRIGFVLLALAVVGLLIAGVLALLSGGGSATQVTVPDLAGLTVDEAEERLVDRGLTLGEQSERADDRPEGTIIEQSPNFPASIDEGSSVDVVVSQGPATTTVPTVVGLSLPDAIAALTRADLVASTERRRSSEPANTVLEADPGEGEEVAEGSTITLTVSNGRVGVPDVVGLDEATATSRLSNAGFNPVRGTEITDDEDPGTVIRQDPASGTALETGSSVTIIIAEAPPEPDPEPTPEPEPTDDPTPPANSNGNGNGPNP